MSRLKWLSMNHNALSTGLPGVEFIAPPQKQASTLDTLGDRRCLRLIGFAVLKEESSSFLHDQGAGSLKGTVLRPDRGTGGTLHSLSRRFSTTAFSTFRTFDSVEIMRRFAVDALSPFAHRQSNASHMAGKRLLVNLNLSWPPHTGKAVTPTSSRFTAKCGAVSRSDHEFGVHAGRMLQDHLELRLLRLQRVNCIDGSSTRSR